MHRLHSFARSSELHLRPGSLKQIGQYASFFFIVAMGIHTFNTLVLRNRPPQWLGIVVTLVGWASALLIGLSIYMLAFFYF
jgi:hypothetical protein